MNHLCALSQLSVRAAGKEMPAMLKAAQLPNCYTCRENQIFVALEFPKRTLTYFLKCFSSYIEAFICASWHNSNINSVGIKEVITMLHFIIF